MTLYDWMAGLGVVGATVFAIAADRDHARHGWNLKTRLVAVLPTAALVASGLAIRFGDAPFGILLAVGIGASVLWVWTMRNPSALPKLLGGPWLTTSTRDIGQR